MDKRVRLAWTCSEISERISAEFAHSDISILTEEAELLAKELGFSSGPLRFRILRSTDSDGRVIWCHVVSPEIAYMKGDGELGNEHPIPTCAFRLTRPYSSEQHGWGRAKQVLRLWIRFIESPALNSEPLIERDKRDKTDVSKIKSEGDYDPFALKIAKEMGKRKRKNQEPKLSETVREFSTYEGVELDKEIIRVRRYINRYDALIRIRNDTQR